MSKDGHPTLKNGKICYLQIPANDINTSSSFYHQVFGWEIRLRDDGAVAFDDSVGEVSGTWVTNRKPSTETGYMVHIMVDDMNASIEAVILHGGQIVQPVGMDAPEITAKFKDPAGNIFGLYQEPEQR